MWVWEGDAGAVLQTLPQSWRFRCIYWDPPFFTGRDRRGDRGAFVDAWDSLGEYLAVMRRHWEAMAERLRPDGFFALHCDWHASHYLKVLGDAIFGYDQFRNEIVWHYTGRRQGARWRLNAKHDVILVWAKSRRALMHPLFEPWDRAQYVRMKRQKVHRDEEGREWIWGHRGRGRSHAYRIYLDEVVRQGRALDDVWDLPILNTSDRERVGYPTQKPTALLRRLLALLTDPGDLVGDFMAGSGTTGVAARELGRRAVLADVNPEAVAVMIERLRPGAKIDSPLPP
ncbi:MAG: site-specific DNA-methyltransferase [Firmicutes bacterium]|nr:site-specific DNA-methyltransferase [Alicyclobacillaceae bacterium]MCL6497943.1 site-specific DNA-methyltransferase [Bacillota bacterium]